MTNGNDFAFNDTATRLQKSGANGITAENPPLTKREYFAAMAMQGLLTRVPHRHDGEVDLGILESQRVAAESAIMANELILALNEQP